jgi:hypothetical protein
MISFPVLPAVPDVSATTAGAGKLTPKTTKKIGKTV